MHNHSYLRGGSTCSTLFLRDQGYSDARKISTDFDEKCKGSESRHVAHTKSHLEAKWVKSWAS